MDCASREQYQFYVSVRKTLWPAKFSILPCLSKMTILALTIAACQQIPIFFLLSLVWLLIKFPPNICFLNVCILSVWEPDQFESRKIELTFQTETWCLMTATVFRSTKGAQNNKLEPDIFLSCLTENVHACAVGAQTFLTHRARAAHICTVCRWLRHCIDGIMARNNTAWAGRERNSMKWCETHCPQCYSEPKMLSVIPSKRWVSYPFVEFRPTIPSFQEDYDSAHNCRSTEMSTKLITHDWSLPFVL